jgi:hypothetical protein
MSRMTPPAKSRLSIPFIVVAALSSGFAYPVLFSSLVDSPA